MRGGGRAILQDPRRLGRAVSLAKACRMRWRSRPRSMQGGRSGCLLRPRPPQGRPGREAARRLPLIGEHPRHAARWACRRLGSQRRSPPWFHIQHFRASLLARALCPSCAVSLRQHVMPPSGPLQRTCVAPSVVARLVASGAAVRPTQIDVKRMATAIRGTRAPAHRAAKGNGTPRRQLRKRLEAQPRLLPEGAASGAAAAGSGWRDSGPASGAAGAVLCTFSRCAAISCVVLCCEAV